MSVIIYVYALGCLGPFELFQCAVFRAKENLQVFEATHIELCTYSADGEETTITKEEHQILIGFQGLFEI